LSSFFSVVAICEERELKMNCELVSIDGVSSIDYKAKFVMPQLALAWEKDLDYEFLRKVKRHLKTLGVKMLSPFPNEGIFYEIGPIDIISLQDVSGEHAIMTAPCDLFYACLSLWVDYL
jgi:hypothetical protein